jgi:hypothetical protein
MGIGSFVSPAEASVTDVSGIGFDPAACHDLMVCDRDCMAVVATLQLLQLLCLKSHAYWQHVCGYKQHGSPGLSLVLPSSEQ